jgi:hypothetical protein
VSVKHAAGELLMRKYNKKTTESIPFLPFCYFSHLDQARSPKYTFKVVNTISEQEISEG